MAGSRTLGLHLLRRTALPALGAALGLAVVAWALQVLRVAPEVLTGATPAGLAARAVVLPFAPILSFVLPVGVAIGLLVAGRSLAVAGTLDALAACGVSPRRLAGPFLAVTLAAALVSGALAVVAEPLALTALLDDAPALARSMFVGRLVPGAITPAGPGTDVFVRASGSDGPRGVLVVRREADGGSTEMAAAALQLAPGPGGEIDLDLRDGSLRVAGPAGDVRAVFSRLHLPLRVSALRARIEAMLPPGLAAPPSAAFDPRALAAASPRDRYLMLRRWSPPLQTLLLGVLVAGLVLGRSPPSRAALVLFVAVAASFALMRLLEPAAAGGGPSGWSAVLLPHLPAGLLASWAAGRLLASGRLVGSARPGVVRTAT